MSFCLRRKADPFRPSLKFMLDYLQHEFRGKGRSYSSINIMRSDISGIAQIDGKPAGQHPLVCRFLKSVFFKRGHPFSQCHCTWNPDVMLTHITTMGPNSTLSIIQLPRKLTVLMLLLSRQRGQTLHLWDIRNMTFSDSRIIAFRIGDPLKTS